MILFFDRFWEPKWSQNGAKWGARVRQKSIKNVLDFWIDFLMRFWSQNGSQNGIQNDIKPIKNHSRTISAWKNVIFSKIAPRLHENTIFEDPGSPKYSQNWPNTFQEQLKNPTEILNEFWMILIRFWTNLNEFWMNLRNYDWILFEWFLNEF